MNTLSWLIYGAEVAGGLSNVFSGLGIVGVCAVVFSLCAVGGQYDDGQPLTALRYARGFAALALACFVFNVAIPSKTTIYMIAASEAGEAAIMHPDSQEMLGDLKELISQRLASELGDGK